jgi:hypothetical protein
MKREVAMKRQLKRTRETSRVGPEQLRYVAVFACDFWGKQTRNVGNFDWCLLPKYDPVAGIHSS